MSILDPANTTLGDLCTEALRECGYIGVGQTPLAEDLNGAWARLQWMLQSWERQRWLVYRLENFSVTSTGATTYTIGPGGDIDTGVNSVRPNRLEYAFLRQLTQGQPNNIDYPLVILQAREDYDQIALKQLQSFPGWIFLDTAWPLGVVYPWPVPQASIYAVHVTIRTQLPFAFATQADVFNIPYEYYAAMLYNLGMALRSKYQMGSFPGDQLPIKAKESKAILRPSNAQIGKLSMPADLLRPGIYNIFSDRSY